MGELCALWRLMVDSWWASMFGAPATLELSRLQRNCCRICFFEPILGHQCLDWTRIYIFLLCCFYVAYKYLLLSKVRRETSEKEGQRAAMPPGRKIEASEWISICVNMPQSANVQYAILLLLYRTWSP
jgi:hypothetical protein